ncbi:ATP-dependent DNA helicase sgs1, partial [Mortierella sp. AD011]
FQHSMAGYESLNFLVDFKKTIVYFETRNETEDAWNYLTSLLPSNLHTGIAVYHSVLTTECKEQVMKRFREDQILILLATEAAGMGCDISNVIRVVQYGYPDNLTSLMQRMGRAARNPALQGHGILLASKKSRKALPEGLQRYISGVECRRKVLNSEFKRHNEGGLEGEPEENVNCCDVCNPDSMFATVEKKLKFLSHKQLDYVYTEEEKTKMKGSVTKWRSEVFESDESANCGWMTEATVIADNKLEDLVKMCSKVIPDLPESLTTVLGWRPLRESYATKLSDHLSEFKFKKELRIDDTIRKRGRLMLEESEEIVNVYDHAAAQLSGSKTLPPMEYEFVEGTPPRFPPIVSDHTHGAAMAMPNNDSGWKNPFLSDRILNSAESSHHATTEKPNSQLPIFYNSNASNFDGSQPKKSRAKRSIKK